MEHCPDCDGDHAPNDNEELTQLKAIAGALADAGTVRVYDDDLARSVRELVAEVRRQADRIHDLETFGNEAHIAKLQGNVAAHKARIAELEAEVERLRAEVSRLLAQEESYSNRHCEHLDRIAKLEDLLREVVSLLHPFEIEGITARKGRDLMDRIRALLRGEGA